MFQHFSKHKEDMHGREVLTNFEVLSNVGEYALGVRHTFTAETKINEKIQKWNRKKLRLAKPLI